MVEKQKLKWITWGVVAMAVLIMGMMLFNTLNRSGNFTLPVTDTLSGQPSGDSSASDALMVVEVTPNTVQTAIATLTRPESYRRTVTVEQFWSGGSSGTYEITVNVLGSWTRTDRTMPDGRVRHTITGDEDVYIWYNHEQAIYTGTVGEISADNEQFIPTYEDILVLPSESIAQADYRIFADINCIYTETVEDTAGYVLRYWVDVDSGLLVATEKLLKGETVYRMAALTIEQSEPAAEVFTLPNGTALI